MTNHPSIAMLCEVARRLGTLCDQVAFLGGATVPLFLSDSVAPPPRSTQDVDVIVRIATRGAYYRFADELKNRGFTEDVESNVLCRWKIAELVVDVMPTDPTILGFTNRWYEDAIQAAQLRPLETEVSIRLVTPPHFIATKIEAFLGRGEADFIGSRDMEDIVAVLDGRAELADEIAACEATLRIYLASQFKSWLANSDFLEALSGHLLPDVASQARRPLLLERLRRIAALN